MATKNYSIGPQDGWVPVTTTAAKSFLRISAVPHTAQYYVYGGSSAPAANAVGVLTCHHPFTMKGNAVADVFYVRVARSTPESLNKDGRLRLDVYTDGATA